MTVDDPSILPNQRGFRNLSGNIDKLTSTPYKPDSDELVILGGRWSDHRLGCRAAFRSGIRPDLFYPSGYSNPSVGLRLSRTIQ